MFGRFFFTLVWVFISVQAFSQVDDDATEKTKTLYANLKAIQNAPFFLFGQEFFNSFQYSSGSAHGDETYSDCFSVTGAHPAVLGSDFHYYLDKSATERSYHTEAVKWAYQQGLAITFDWHLSGKGTTTYEYREATKDLVDNIVAFPDGEDRQWFFGELDKVIAIINNDLVVDDERIPFVFRPFHEMNGGWFWWGTQATTAANYKLLYQLTVEYVKERTTSVLFCWSPNTPTNFNYYPGDEFVDVLGLDAYEINTTSFRQNMALIADHAQANNKVAVFSESGFRNDGTNGDMASMYWKDTIIPAIVDDPSGKAIKIAWVLTWINASWSVPYVPHPASSTVAKQSFMDFKNLSYTIFSDEVQNMYEPWMIVAAPQELGEQKKDIKIFPVPAHTTFTIQLEGFVEPARISIYDMTGKVVFETEMDGNELTLAVDDLPASGIYLVRAIDRSKSISKKLIIQR